MHNWGGDFYADGLCDLLQFLGGRLVTLYLIHVDELDMRALKIISNACPNLQTLGFYNCIFKEPEPAVSSFDDHGIKMLPMLDVSKLALVSDCSRDYIVQIVSSVLNVRHLITGGHFFNDFFSQLS